MVPTIASAICSLRFATESWRFTRILFTGMIYMLCLADWGSSQEITGGRIACNLSSSISYALPFESFWSLLCIVYPINYKPEMLKLFQFDPIQVQLANRCLVFCQRWMNIEIHSRISSIVCREWMKEITQSDIIYALIYSTFCGKRLQWLNLNKLNEGLKTNPSVGLSDRCNDFLFGLDFRRDFMMHALCLAYALDG